MIKVMMKGIRTRSVFEDELSDEDRDELKRKHEEMMRQYEEERVAAEKRHEEEAKKSHERIAFLINAIAPFGNDVHPNDIAAAQKTIGTFPVETVRFGLGLSTPPGRWAAPWGGLCAGLPGRHDDRKPNGGTHGSEGGDSHCGDR